MCDKLTCYQKTRGGVVQKADTMQSIGGDLDIDDKGSEQRRFKPVLSLHHGSVGYQPVRTRIGRAKKAMFLQANREHKQEHERTILNCR
jgi:hypothetical protein